MITPELTREALLALEQAAVLCKEAPLERSMALRFVLAYLFSAGSGDRWPFDSFWEQATRPVDPGGQQGPVAIGRSQGVNACLNAIYRHVDVERTAEMMHVGPARMGIIPIKLPNGAISQVGKLTDMLD